MKTYYNKEKQPVRIDGHITRLDGKIELNPRALTPAELASQCGLFEYEHATLGEDEYYGELTFEGSRCFHKKEKKDLETLKAEKLQKLDEELDFEIREFQIEQLKSVVRGGKANKTIESITNEYRKRKKEIETTTKN